MASCIENPRGYQSEILQRARDTNIIAFLETGAGKTLVSALLIRDILKQPSNRCKIAVFIVEKVALVHQQAEYMEDVSDGDFKVGTYYGSMGLDEWSIDRWMEEIASKRIMVLTAQIFLNALNHGRISMKSVAILVFDEVHHATGEHPFRRIMVDFYHTLDESKRPRVFGMTASPVKRAGTKSVEDCAETIAVLEVTMDAKIFGVSDESQEELESIVPNAFEFVALYAGNKKEGEEEEEDDDTLKEDELAMNSGLDALVPSLAPSQSRNRKREAGNRKKHVTIKKGSSAHIDLLLKKVHLALGRHVATFLSNELADTSGDLQYRYGKNSIRKRLCHGPLISDHVRVLLDMLVQEAKRWKLEHNNDDLTFRCIVFVHQRLFAFAVAWLINTILGPLKESCFEARAVVGCHAKSSHLRMSQSQQNEVLNEFRRGTFGVLVATNVVEEGLDIPACRVVIAFDAVLSAKSYIQARGRARSPGSHYIALLPRNSPEHLEYISRAYEGAKFMKETVREMNAKAGTEWIINLVAEAKKSIQSENSGDVLLSKETTARVHPVAAITLLNRYVWGLQESQRRVDAVYKTKSTEEGYVGTVILPQSSPVRIANSTAQSSELLAKQIAALNAYKALYEIGEVDHYLLPVLRYERKPQVEGPRYRGTKGPKLFQTVRQCNVNHPKPLKRARIQVSENQEDIIDESLRPIYLYYIRRNQHPHESAQPENWKGGHCFGIIVENEIVEEDLESVICPIGDPLISLEFVSQLEWSYEQREMCRNYMHVVEGCVRGRMPKWLSNLGDETETESVPNSPNDSIESGSSKDRESADVDNDNDTATEHTETATEVDDDPFEFEKEKIQVKFLRRQDAKIRRDNERRPLPPGFFFVPLVERNETKEVDWEGVEKLNNFKVDRYGERSTTDDWSFTLAVSSHETNDRIYLIGNVMKDVKVSSKPHNAVCPRFSRFSNIAEYYMKRHNIDLSTETEDLLEGFGASEIMLKKQKSFPLSRSTCYHIPLPPWAVYTAALLPSWQTYLVLKEAWRSICENRSLEFLSFSRSVQPNMGSIARIAPELNYERNEFLGDAVLKLVSSMMAYVRAPKGNEGQLTDFRDDEIGNDNLCNIAVANGIPNCIAYTGITPKAKKWEWFWGIPQIKILPFSEKVLADCVEALIGAHYLEGGLASAVKFMDRLQVVPNAETILQGYNFDSQGVKDRTRHDRKTDPRIAKVEQILGYTFNSKDIVVEALTHGSYASGKAQSYQRLEFLGDAVVGFLLLSKYFAEYTTLPPGELSAVSDPMLSNSVFARVVVAHGLHELIWSDCNALKQDIKKFAKALANEKEGEDVCTEQAVPKVLGDILESLVGAIVVDQGMKLDGVLEIVVTLMKSILDQFANPESIDQHPVSRLAQRIQNMYGLAPEWVIREAEKVEESNEGRGVGVRISRGMMRSNNQETSFECSVMVAGTELGKGCGPTSRVAKHRAAVDALKAFEGLA